MKIFLTEKKNLETLFGMGGGWILDFSNLTFQDFVLEYTGRDVENKKYIISGGSKAHRLRGFWKVEDDAIVIKLNLALLDYLRTQTIIKEENKTLYNEVYDHWLALKHKHIATVGVQSINSIGDNPLNQEFITEQLSKMQKKITENDYSGAITNARTLVEQILIEVGDKIGADITVKGDLLKLYKNVSKELKLNPAEYDEDGFKQILRGLTNIVNGIASVRNSFSDSHGRKYKPSLHHAKLMVNSAHTICEFIVDTYQYQRGK